MKKRFVLKNWVLFTFAACLAAVLLYLTVGRDSSRFPASSDELTIPHHEKLWALPDKHGKAYWEASLVGKADCLGCHGEGGPVKEKYPKFYIQCNSCHEAFPHIKDFESGHEIIYGENKVPKNIAAIYEGQCTNCHKPIKENGKDGFSLFKDKDMKEEGGCYFCHDKRFKPTATWGKKITEENESAKDEKK